MVTRFLRLFVAPGLVFAGLALPQPSARAGMVTFTASTGGSALAGQSYANFDNRPLGSISQPTGANLVVSSNSTNAAFVQGSVPSQYAAPIVSGLNNMFFEPTNPATSTPDTTTYVSTGVGAVTLAFASGSSSYLGILWGSIDTYNSLRFNFTDGTSQTIGGSSILSMLGVGGGGTTAYVNFTGSAFSSVVASSTSNSFEFDNVAYSTAAVPEPSSMALCGIAGFAAMGLVQVRRRRVVG